jgi:probable HAF family extracellular repeat protein
MVDLGTLPGGTYSEGFAINSPGQIAGAADTPSASQHAFIWTPANANGTTGSMTDLGTMTGGTYSEAVGINNTGQVTGDADPAPGGEHAFIYPAPNGCATPVASSNGSGSGTFCDLGTLSGGTYSAGNGINDSSEVVGQADDALGNALPFLYSGGTMYGLGSLGGTRGKALAVNNAGQVVGTSDVAGDAAEHAFVWTPGSANGTTGTLTDLNTITKLPRGVTLTGATNINTNGWIVGWSQNSASPGSAHAFLLQP